MKNTAKNKIPHPMAVYTVIAIGVILSLTILTPSNINAMASSDSGSGIQLQYHNMRFCSELCQPAENDRLGIYVQSPSGNLECISLESYINERRCCHSYECQIGSDCISGVCR